MTLTVIVLPAAEEDIGAAVDHYNSVRVGCGEFFRLEVDRAIQLMQLWPDACERVSQRHRRVLLRRFPYMVIYRPLTDHIRVLAVLPTRRDPAVLHNLQDR